MGRALIVSAGASSNEYISARLTELGYARPIIVPSAAEARRRMLESDFELIVVNSPLPDEFGHELCADAVEKTDAGVIFLAKAAAAEQLLTPLSEEGVLLVTKPFSNTFFLQAIQMAAASNHRLLLVRQESSPLRCLSRTGNGKRQSGCCLPEGAAGEPRQVLPHRAGPHDRGRGAPLHREKSNGHPARPRRGRAGDTGLLRPRAMIRIAPPLRESICLSCYSRQRISVN